MSTENWRTAWWYWKTEVILSYVWFPQSLPGNRASGVRIIVSILFWMNTNLSTQLVKEHIGDTLGHLSNYLILFLKFIPPWKNKESNCAPVSAPFHIVMGLRKNELYPQFLTILNRSWFRPHSFEAVMGFIMCMWANADQGNVRKSSRGFLREKHKASRWFPLLPPEVTAS